VSVIQSYQLTGRGRQRALAHARRAQQGEEKEVRCVRTIPGGGEESEARSRRSKRQTCPRGRDSQPRPREHAARRARALVGARRARRHSATAREPGSVRSGQDRWCISARHPPGGGGAHQLEVVATFLVAAFAIMVVARCASGVRSARQKDTPSHFADAPWPPQRSGAERSSCWKWPWCVFWVGQGGGDAPSNLLPRVAHHQCARWPPPAAAAPRAARRRHPHPPVNQQKNGHCLHEPRSAPLGSGQGKLASCASSPPKRATHAASRSAPRP